MTTSATSVVIGRMEAWMFASLPPPGTPVTGEARGALSDRIMQFAEDLVSAADIDGIDVDASHLETALDLAAALALEDTGHAC